MSLIKGLQRRPLLAITAVVACIALGVAIWQAPELPAKASSSEERQNLQKQLRKGVGNEVRFATKSEEVDEAVASAADFIYWRSGLQLSSETRKKLAKAERDVLNGKSAHITATELIDDMTTSAVERLATLTDEEIQAVTEASSDDKGQIRSRADARLGVLTKKDLIQQAQAGREWSKRGDTGLQLGLRSVIEEEVNNRVTTLSMMLPEQFGNVNSQGLTPTQAFVVAYSVAADDPLTNSRSDIAEMLKQQRMEERQTREQWKAEKSAARRPYGPRGLLHPSAPQLFLNKSSVDKLLNLSEGGKN